MSECVIVLQREKYDKNEDERGATPICINIIQIIPHELQGGLLSKIYNGQNFH